MMSADVLLIGSIACLALSFLEPLDSLMPDGFLLLVMAMSIWVRERKRQ